MIILYLILSAWGSGQVSRDDFTTFSFDSAHVPTPASNFTANGSQVRIRTNGTKTGFVLHHKKKKHPDKKDR